jgi:transposase
MARKGVRMARIRTWEISDEFWSRVEPLLPESRRTPGRACQRRPGGGRKAKYSERTYFSAIVYVLRTGIIWNALPRERFGGLCSSAVHARFRQWARAGLFEALWRRGLAEYDEMEGIKWQWQSADGACVEAPLARESVGANPTDRGKKWKPAPCSRRRQWRPALVGRERGRHPRQPDASSPA